MADSVVRRVTWRVSDVARVMLLGLLFVFLWRFFWLVHSALFLGLLSVLLAIVIHAPARWLTRFMPFRLAFGLVAIAFLALIAGLFMVLIPQMITQGSQLAQQLPAATQALEGWAERSLNMSAAQRADLSARANEQVGQFVGRFVPLAFNAISTLLGAFALIVLALFFAAEPAVYRDLVLRLASPTSRPRLEEVYDESGRSLRSWVIGKALTMAGVGVFTYFGLMLLGVPGALALAALAAIMEFIPNFGPIIAAVPAMIAAFLVEPRIALYVGLFYLVLQQVQSAVTVPLVERRAVNIPPAALLLWQLVLTIGFGFLGLFVATPLLAVIATAVRILYVEPAEDRARADRRDHTVVETLPDQPQIALVSGLESLPTTARRGRSADSATESPEGPDDSA